MTNSFKYLMAYKSQSRASYPYTAVRSTCKYNSANGVVNTNGYKNIPANSYSGHMAAI